ncbi:hypothetical protein ILUMI_24649 [Ignelater luminosus]|uniref:UDP-glucuronosyltransferase n=1 Tax=Ignelater luminosus TaxID=2038154 RepID=A0A8K0CD26_IGNLU|nr:hypothetical protein ILUMI_24649 [Ignelater luminosus]
MKPQTVYSLILLIILPCLNGYKILGVFPHPGKSHFDFFEPLMKELAHKGHEVTVISHFPQKIPLKGYTDISIVDGSHLKYNNVNITHFTGSRLQQHLNSHFLAQLGWAACDNGYTQKAFQDFLKSRPKFDVILMEYFNTDCYLPLAHILKAPLIGLSSCAIMPWTNLQMGFPDNPGYVPIPFIGVHDKMTFFERVENTVLYLLTSVIYKLLIDIPSHETVKKHLGDDIPPLSEIAANTSLVLTNMHFSLTLPRPLPPGFIEVSGMNIGKSKKLPENLEKWISGATHGVVYLSLGSMIKLHTFPEEKTKAFLKALGRLPQRVIWKWEAETLPDQPSNVMIQKWLPQLDILCHPNVKAYIAHGGLLGTTEAVHCGVPMVVLPQFGDQFTNAKALEKTKGGVVLDFWSLNENTLYDAVKTVLEPSFQESAKQLSDRFNDRPMPAMDTAIYWVEYVARHKGAPHLKTAAVGMPLYQYLLIDVIAFLLLVLFVVTYMFYFLVRTIFRKIFVRSSVKKLKKN